MLIGINKIGVKKGRFKKGDAFWKGKKRSEEDKKKMSVPKSTKYIDLGRMGVCKLTVNK